MPHSVKTMMWNLQRMSPRQHRMKPMLSTIKKYKADLVFLSEVSHDLTLPGYDEIGHAHSLNEVKSAKGRSENELNLKLFLRRGSRVKVHGVRVGKLRQGQPRMRLKAHIELGGTTFGATFVHNKATEVGGAEGVAELEEKIRKKRLAFAGGDLNVHLDDPAVLAATQAGGTDVVLMRDAAGQAIETHRHKKTRRTSILDAMLAGDQVEVEAVPELVNTRKILIPKSVLRDAGKAARKATWRRGTFWHVSDHRPVIYRVRKR